MSLDPSNGFDYRSKADILPAVLKGGALIAGGLLSFNYLVDKPMIGDVLVTYRKTMHRFFKSLSSGHIKDPQLLDAGAMSALDLITLSGAAVTMGSLGLFYKNPLKSVEDVGKGLSLER